MIRYQAIGRIESPFGELSGMPIQPSAARGVKGRVVIHNDFLSGLKDLEGFSHIILLYHFHRAGKPVMQVKPFLDESLRGLFATRAPNRPNSIGLSIVRLLEVRGNVLQIADVDVLSGTPLLDIKPYVPYFDQPGSVRLGWLEHAQDQAKNKLSDDRFLT